MEQFKKTVVKPEIGQFVYWLDNSNVNKYSCGFFKPNMPDVEYWLSELEIKEFIKLLHGKPAIPIIIEYEDGKPIYCQNTSDFYVFSHYFYAANEDGAIKAACYIMDVIDPNATVDMSQIRFNTSWPAMFKIVNDNGYKCDKV